MTGERRRAVRGLQPAPAGGELRAGRAALHRHARTACSARSTTSATGSARRASPPRPRRPSSSGSALGFAYMTVITGICLVVQADVVRYRPLLLVLAAGKAASLAGRARLLPLRRRRLRLPPELPRRRLPRRRRALLWSLAGPGRRPAGAHLKARPGAERRRAAHPARVRRGDGAGRGRAAAPPARTSPTRVRSTSPGRSPATWRDAPARRCCS